MSQRKFIIVSGYYSHPASAKHGLSAEEFFPIWQTNNVKYVSNIKPYVDTYIINVSGFGQKDGWLGQWIAVDNLGHADNLPLKQRVGGWSAAFLMGCMLALHRKCDLVFKEQDCLAFGPWLDVLYSVNKGLVTGRTNVGGPAHTFVPQSLVLVRNAYLTDFIQRYLAIPESDREEFSIPERKFERIGAATREHGQANIGYDRSRPVNYGDAAFYLQQISLAEIEQLKQRGLI